MKADHQWCKNPFTQFLWIGPNIIDRLLPNNNYLARKFGTKKM